MMTDWEVLTTAADVIEVRGLAKHILQDATGRVCLRGALLVAQGVTGPLHAFVHRDDESDEWRRLIDVEARYLSPLVPNEYWDPVAWNNWPERTQAEVVALLRQGSAIARLEQSAQAEPVSEPSLVTV